MLFLSDGTGEAPGVVKLSAGCLEALDLVGVVEEVVMLVMLVLFAGSPQTRGLGEGLMVVVVLHFFGGLEGVPVYLH